ncbi:MAG: hypothetical protein KDN22_21830 [Verrucomicrobiae bacterium]|nr:hypothetical protein [Verrucomicrobiae bacterium]
MRAIQIAACLLSLLSRADAQDRTSDPVWGKPPPEVDGASHYYRLVIYPPIFRIDGEKIQIEKGPFLVNEIVRGGSDFLLERAKCSVEGRFVVNAEGGRELLLKLYLGLRGANPVNWDPVVLAIGDQQNPTPISISGMVGSGFLMFQAQLERIELNEDGGRET